MSEDLSKDISSALSKVTKKWKTAKRSADINDRVSSRSLSYLRYSPPRTTVREAAFQVMEEAYNKASSNGKYYANARQIMYAARPLILKLIDRPEPWRNSSYFTQTLLKDYIEYYGGSGWRVVWDARGHIKEPHTNNVIGLGGAEVMNYINKWMDHNFDISPNLDCDIKIKTKGPVNRFNSVLFIEKEGFNEIFEDAKIPDKYDIAIMSTKGIPVKAACDLALELDSKGVRIFVLHDFDYDGFKIIKTLNEGTRMSHGTPVIDLGFRIDDIEGLESEPVSRSGSDPEYYLRRCGATEEEIKFLVTDSSYRSWSGNRVELNAMTSEQLIDWLKNKFEKHGVNKLIPDTDILKNAYRRAIFSQRLEEKIEEIKEGISEDGFDIPNDLSNLVKEKLEKTQYRSWDDVIWDIAGDNEDEE